MGIKKLEDIITAARAKGKKRLVVACGTDVHTLEAVNDAIDMGIVEATLVGNLKMIEHTCKELKIDIKRFKIVEELNDTVAINRAVQMVSSGEGDVLMKGLVSTDRYMRGILSKEFGLVPPKGVLSHMSVMELPMYHKLLLVSDVAILLCPDMKQKVAIINYFSATAKMLGIKQPKIACISASEQVLPTLESSVEGAMLAKMADRGQLGDVLVDGPLALDVALVKEVVELKGLTGSSVAGDTDCLLFPTLDAANTFFKTVTQLIKADIACMVVGTTSPCVLTSRGDTRSVKLNSIALACLSVKQR